MPHKYYHGKTGYIWNITPRAIGVEVNKLVKNRIIKKRIHVRLEHVQPSKSKAKFLERVKENDNLRRNKKIRRKIAFEKNSCFTSTTYFSQE